ncbi:MAG TPA: ATP-binding protein, partial [Thiothrix sp.]|nr:ATP-binding protein [Thiothrix sp.]
YQLSRVSTQQQQHLQQAKKQLDGLQNRLLKENSDWARFAPALLKDWQTWLAAEIENNENIATREIPNPFYFSKPLNPNMGSEVFRGREATVQHIERLLCDSQQSLSIVLLAPRRSGKSSLLKMLPQLLPQAVFIFYDLQDNPAEHIEGFFYSLITQVKTQTYVERSITLPDRPNETTLSQSDAWFKQVDEQLTQPLLICIDEFERLPTLLPNENNDLLRLMAWFRATIQHRQNVRLLISGAAAFDELDRIWDDHFINLQTLKLPHLSADVCLDLLRQPTAHFPTEVMPPAVAEYIIERTQGQPYLTQALAGTGIEYINYHGLKQLELSLMDVIEQQVLERCSGYFRDVYYSAPKAAQPLFYRLSHGETLDLATENKAAVRWLKQRLLITEAGEVNIPLFARWVRDWVERD